MRVQPQCVGGEVTGGLGGLAGRRGGACVLTFQVWDPPAFVADHGLCPWMSGVPSSVPFPGLHLSVFFSV